MITTWDTKKILEYCPQQSTEDAKIYFKAIQSKIDRIDFSKRQIEKYFYLTLSTLTDRNDRENFLELKLNIVIYLESIADNLHSLPDVLANIITFLILPPDSEPKGTKITIKKIIQILSKLQNDKSVESWRKTYYKSIVDAINNLLYSDEYQYINAFVNTIKHPHLIDTEYLIQNNAGSYNSDWRFLEFERNGRQYSSISINKLINDYQNKIVSLFYKVGEEINNYCRAFYIGKYSNKNNNSTRVEDVSSIWDLGKNPVECDVIDGAVNHDKYLLS